MNVINQYTSDVRQSCISTQWDAGCRGCMFQRLSPPGPPGATSLHLHTCCQTFTPAQSGFVFTLCIHTLMRTQIKHPSWPSILSYILEKIKIILCFYSEVSTNISSCFYTLVSDVTSVIVLTLSLHVLPLSWPNRLTYWLNFGMEVKWKDISQV